MKFSVQLPIQWNSDHDTFHDGATLAALARDIETQGFHACFVTEHPAPTLAWLESGGHSTIDPFVALSFAAAGTERLRLHANILVLSYRNPLLVAKAVASLDTLSGGRMICGVGVGYMEGEFRALGADFSRRGKTADEALAVMRQAWTGAPVNYAGAGFSAENNVVLPRPRQLPHPPIWVGGNGDRAIERAVRFGTGWSPFPTQRAGVTEALASIEQLEERIGRMRALCAQHGRAPLDVCMVPFGWSMTSSGAAPDPAALVEQLRRLRDIGVTWIVLALDGESRDHYRERLQLLGEQVLPHFAC